MRRNGVVKALDVGENGIFGVTPGAKMRQMDQLAFQTAEEVFRNGIVIRTSDTLRNWLKAAWVHPGSAERENRTCAACGIWKPKSEPCASKLRRKTRLSTY